MNRTGIFVGLATLLVADVAIPILGVRTGLSIAHGHAGIWLSIANVLLAIAVGFCASRSRKFANAAGVVLAVATVGLIIVLGTIAYRA